MLSFGFDGVSDWAVVDCDAAGCAAHVAVRVIEEGYASEIALQEAAAAGWTMTDIDDRCEVHSAGAGQGPHGGRAA